MSSIMDKIKNTRILATIGIAGVILGVIFPYIKYTFWGYTTSITLWNYWQGKIMMVLALANVLLIFKDIVEKYVPALFNTSIGAKVANMNNPKTSLIPTIIIAIITIYLHATVADGFSLDILGMGFYFLWIGTICLIAYAFLHKGDMTSANM